MATHTDTNGLLKYNPKNPPNIPGGDVNYLNRELQTLSNTISKMVDVLKLIEARLNNNGLT
jgi:CII-binding regulator of phage lambda lysogenization HflD